MAHAILRNDAAHTTASADRANQSVEEFRSLTRQFAATVSGGTGLEGQAQTALAAAGQRTAEAGDRFHAIASPRVDSLRQSAQASMQVGDDAAGALNGVDVAF